MVPLAFDETSFKAVRMCGSSMVKSSCRSGRETGPHEPPLGDEVYCASVIAYVCGEGSAYKLVTLR